MVGVIVLLSGVLVSCHSDTRYEFDESKLGMSGNRAYLELDTTVLPLLYSDEGIEIQLPGVFRTQRPADFEDLKNGSWYEFYQHPNSQDFYLTEANAEVGKGFDECIGDSSTYVTSKHEIKPIFFIKGLNEPADRLNSVKLTQNMVWSGSSMAFVFNDQDYVLEGDGYVLAEDNPAVDD